jgi:hypothetical protein
VIARLARVGEFVLGLGVSMSFEGMRLDEHTRLLWGGAVCLFGASCVVLGFMRRHHCGQCGTAMSTHRFCARCHYQEHR